MRQLSVIALVALLGVVVAGLLATPVRSQVSAVSCAGPGYSYGIFASDGRFHGISGTIRELKQAIVQHGHVAGWLNIGDGAAGPHHTKEWLQVGLNRAEGSSSSHLYYEVYAPGVSDSDHYHELLAAVPLGEAHQIALLEMHDRPNVWRVWVDGKPVSPPYTMPHPAGGWSVDVAGETWDGGVVTTCNAFSYAIENVRAAAAAGGVWRKVGSGSTVDNVPYRIRQWVSGDFIAELEPSLWPPPASAPAQP